MKIRLKVPLSAAAILLGSWNSAAWAQGIAGGERGQVALELLESAAANESARKQELIASILSAREAAASRKFTDEFRGHLAGLLRSGSVERLEALMDAGGLGDIRAAVQDGMVTNFFGESAKDLVFTPLPPCRIVDTRSAVAGILVASSTRHFKVRDVAGFAAQGGSATDCGIPLAASAVEMNFVAVSAVGPGDLRAYAFGGILPGSSVINYSNVPGAPFLNIANGIAQPVCDPAGATPCTNDLSILTEASNTHMVIDVVGYYAAPKTAITVLRYTGSNSDATVSSAYEQFRVVGNFTKQAAASAITTTWDAHVQTVGTVGTSFCHYQVRIDGLSPAGAGSFPGVVNYGDHQAVSRTDYWTGLTAGVHAVTIWVRGISATSCGANFGNFEQQVIVKEQ